MKKRVTRAAAEDAPRPLPGAFVRCTYTARLEDSTVVDATDGEPIELQLTRALTDGLHRCLETMSHGEVAEVRCAPGFAWSRGDAGLPTGEAVVYEVELVDSRAGPPEPPMDDAALLREAHAEQAALSSFHQIN